MVTLTLATLALAGAQAHVGPDLAPTGQRLRPAGKSLGLDAARPVDLVAARDGKTAFLKDRTGLRIVDLAAWREVGKLAVPGGASLWGMHLAANDRLFFTDAGNGLVEIDVSYPAAPQALRTIALPGPGGKGQSFPCGVRVRGNLAYVCLSRNNTLGVVDLAEGSLVAEIPVGIAPYDVEITPDGTTAYVSNQGGRRPKAQEKTATTAGTPAPVDERGVVATGSVSVVDLASRKTKGEVLVGLQPADLLLVPGPASLIVASANADTVSWIDLKSRRVAKTLVAKPAASLPFGSMPNALALSPDLSRLYVALAGNNAVAVVSGPASANPKVVGCIPTGWYPTAVAVSQGRLLVANAKGLGSRTRSRTADKGWNSHDHRGTIQAVPIPDAKALAQMNRVVLQDAMVPMFLRQEERVRSSRAKPVPVPARLGDPSVFEHVVYVIKENRTYDQILGDLERGERDPRLCTFPERVSPNHHALARQYALLDNYYCNGVLSADGHSWATEGNVTPYLERAFGGFNRSYTFGDDPLTYSTTGFLWDHVLAGGLSFRNYGEMDYAEFEKPMTLAQTIAAWKSGKAPTFKQQIGVERLRRYSSRDYPGWNMNIPDGLRIDRFLKEFREFEKNGRFPNLTIVYLPQDHGAGELSPDAYMADNDLAVGRLVEAISRSRFWKKTAIFVNEDDPQAGYDHVDGHRSICLVVSPYTKRKTTVSAFYNQTSVLATILRIFGLPPMNQRDATSPLMSAVFTTKPDFRPFRALPAQVPLDLKPKAATSRHPNAVKLAARVKRVPLARTGMKTPADEDALNRYIWHEAKGYGTPYPAEWAGPHGKGLAARGLAAE